MDWADTILSEYENRFELFKALEGTSVRLVKDLLREKGITVHTVSGRVKARDKLAAKLSKKGYRRLEDVTDVVGIRVIALFEKEVSDISRLVEQEFTVDWPNSMDKGKTLPPDSFGYLSLHYICSLSDGRLKLVEYARFHGLKFEIQIRSILQHAWAEIEHDLGYKRGQGVPTKIRRRFSRLAGLLELADQEFGAIRADLEHYETEVRSEVRKSPDEIGIDNITLSVAFDEKLVREIDEQLAKGIDAPIREDNIGILSILSVGLPWVGVTTVAQLLQELKQNRELLVYQAMARFKDKGQEKLYRGFSVLQLLWVLMGLQGEETMKKGLAELSLAGGQPNEEFAHDMVARIHEFGTSKAPANRLPRGQNASG